MKSLSSVLVALAAAGFMPVCGAEAQTIALFTKNNTNPFSQAIRVGSNAAAVALSIETALPRIAASAASLRQGIGATP